MVRLLAASKENFQLPPRSDHDLQEATECNERERGSRYYSELERTARCPCCSIGKRRRSHARRGLGSRAFV